MKKSILTLLAAFSLGSLVAQSNSPSTNTQSGSSSTTKQGTTTTTQQGTNMQTPQSNTQVPGSVSKRFNTDYPSTNSTWTTAGTNYRAEYMDPKTKTGRAVYYDTNGNPVGMERELSRSEYPASINEYYTASYPNEEYRVWTSDDKTGKRNYFITRKTEVVWFDDKGTYVRKEARPQDVAR